VTDVHDPVPPGTGPRDTDAVAFITGAASGVGAATAARFLAAGARVVLTDRNADAVTATAERLDPGAERTLALAADVTDDTAVATAVREAADRWGRLDVVVNNAGVPHAAVPFDRLAAADWRRAFGVNVVGIAVVTAAALPLLRASRGAVVNVTSVAGQRARPGLAAYCASKAAAISLTQTLALELAGDRIRVNAIAPGALDTPMFGDFLRPGEGVPEGIRRYEQAIPLGRLGQPEEIADAVYWAALGGAGFMTGQTIIIDGGRAL
jgi:3-oxoacyl-[acyl-carrier protein] reductase